MQVEKQLRVSVNAAHTPPSIWQTAWVEDPHISEYRAFLSLVMMPRPSRTSSKRDLLDNGDGDKVGADDDSKSQGSSPVSSIVSLDSPIKKQRACDVCL